MTRNTRFFRDFLKDQIKEQNIERKKKSGKIEEQVVKQDSLTNNIQKESGAPLRRMTMKAEKLKK